MFDLSKILDLRKNLLFPTPCLNRKTTVQKVVENLGRSDNDMIQ